MTEGSSALKSISKTCCMISSENLYLITPCCPYIEYGGTSDRTVVPDAITAPFPIVTHDKTVTPDPNHTSSPIIIGPFLSNFSSLSP